MVVHAAGASVGVRITSASARSTTRAASGLSGTRWYRAGSAVMKDSLSDSGKVDTNCRSGTSVSATRPSAISTCNSYCPASTVSGWASRQARTVSSAAGPDRDWMAICAARLNSSASPVRRAALST